MKKLFQRIGKTLSLGVLVVLAAGCSDSSDPAPSEPPYSDPDRYVLAEGGTFMRGMPDDEDFSAPNEHPYHQVTVSPFYIGKYEITQKEWKDVMGLTVEEQHTLSGQAAANFRGSGDNLPINFVSWYDAVEFCNQLSRKDGLTPAYQITTGGTWNAPTVEVAWIPGTNGWRMPTEAEWEYACRAGTATRYNTGDTEEDLAAAAWYTKNSEIEVEGANKAMLHEVGGKTANAWGIYDMHGNVWEWCWDIYVANYDDYANGTLPTTDPTGGTEGDNRVTRGGAFNNTITRPNVDFFYSARRVQTSPSSRGQNYGLRIVRSKL